MFGKLNILNTAIMLQFSVYIFYCMGVRMRIWWGRGVIHLGCLPPGNHTISVCLVRRWLLRIIMELLYGGPRSYFEYVLFGFSRTKY